MDDAAHGRTPLPNYRSLDAIEATIQLLHNHSRNSAVMKHTLDVLDAICIDFPEYKDFVNHSLSAIPQEKWREIFAAVTKDQVDESFSARVSMFSWK
jgi:hypothetical protein